MSSELDFGYGEESFVEHVEAALPGRRICISLNQPDGGGWWISLEGCSEVLLCTKLEITKSMLEKILAKAKRRVSLVKEEEPKFIIYKLQ